MIGVWGMSRSINCNIEESESQQWFVEYGFLRNLGSKKYVILAVFSTEKNDAQISKTIPTLK